MHAITKEFLIELLNHIRGDVYCPDVERRVEKLIAQPDMQLLLKGARVKLNFNKAGNMTSLRNMEHDLQGKWVALIDANTITQID